MDTDTLQRDLGRVEGKLDSVIELLKGNEAKHAELETRVRKVEGKVVYFSGAALAVGVLFAKVDFTKLISVAHATGALG